MTLIMVKNKKTALHKKQQQKHAKTQNHTKKPKVTANNNEQITPDMLPPLPPKTLLSASTLYRKTANQLFKEAEVAYCSLSDDADTVADDTNADACNNNTSGTGKDSDVGLQDFLTASNQGTH